MTIQRRVIGGRNDLTSLDINMQNNVELDVYGNPIIERIAVENLDWIYLSYDEPQKQKFYNQMSNRWPWIKHVDGVRGSDAAHKRAAEVSETHRFVLIDGDNLPDTEFETVVLTITEANREAQFRWRARNHINGLYYGNGGMSCWTKSYVSAMRTHEASNGDAHTNIEFCFDPLYWPMHNCYSTTYPNGSPKQAFRAGFREGVKMCSRDGVMPYKHDKSNFINHVWPRNLQRLSIWQTLGRDVENGFWAILGARLGTHYLMLRDWDYVSVRDFGELDKIWELHKNDDEQVANTVRTELNRALGTDIAEVSSEGSKFFKNYIARGWHNRDPMIREITVIRQEEGW